MKSKLILVLASMVTLGAAAQDMKDCPMHAQHVAASSQAKEHNDGVNKRGAAHEGMGFSQSATTHHFLLTEDGGIIQVTANDATDKDSIAEVQQHFEHIQMAFANGDFSIPHFVHDQTVPGVKVMKLQKAKIRYTAEKMENGARLRMETKSPEALKAIHDFLRFQIADHRTGDPGTVEASSK
jgi:hypothetical protein